MTEFRKVTDQVFVAPQISVDDVARAAAQGFVLIINNRPDGEAPDQTPAAEIAAAAEASGLAYLWVPITGMPTRGQAEMVIEAVREASGPVLAYCRSGTRSINTWALGSAVTGDRSPTDLVQLGAAAGYDLHPLLG